MHSTDSGMDSGVCSQGKALRSTQPGQSCTPLRSGFKTMSVPNVGQININHHHHHHHRTSCGPGAGVAERSSGLDHRPDGGGQPPQRELWQPRLWSSAREGRRFESG